MKKIILLVLLSLCSSNLWAQLCFNPSKCHVGNYRLVGELACSDTIDNKTVNNLTINADGSWLMDGVGAYYNDHLDNDTQSFIQRTYVTTSFTCTGTWTKNGREAPMTGNCDVTDQASYSTSFESNPQPRSLVDTYQTTFDMTVFLPPNDNQTLIAYTDPDNPQTLTIQGGVSERHCVFSGDGVRRKDNDPSMLPMVEGPIDPVEPPPPFVNHIFTNEQVVHLSMSAPDRGLGASQPPQNRQSIIVEPGDTIIWGWGVQNAEFIGCQGLSSNPVMVHAETPREQNQGLTGEDVFPDLGVGVHNVQLVCRNISGQVRANYIIPFEIQ